MERAEGDFARASTAPPGWNPGFSTPALHAVDRVDRTDGPSARALARGAEPADAATRWRIGAAFIDNLIVYAGYMTLCALMHWQVASLGHLWLLVVMGVGYHFALEAHGGQTLGKRRYGIAVVSVDGGPPSAGAVAVRSVLRIVDQLPLWYVSGLVSMVRTGPARRQRIGDVAAGTMVVAVDGHAADRGTPGWMLPAATILATLLSALAAVAVSQAGSRPLDAAQRAQFVAGCEQGPVSQVVSCRCLLTQLEAAGYDTPDALRGLMAQALSEAAARTPGSARVELSRAASACQR